MLTITAVEFERIISDPSASYREPYDVLQDARLSREQKITVLKQWAFDEQELEVAEEENMRGAPAPLVLDQVLMALHQIEQSK